MIPLFTKAQAMAKNEIIFGVGPVYELLRSGRRSCHVLIIARDERGAAVQKIVSIAERANVKIVRADRAELGVRCKGANHQGVAAEVDVYTYCDVGDLIVEDEISQNRGFLIILDGITDPHNLGSIIRTAHLMGVNGIIIPQDNSASINATVAKTSAGAIEYVKIAQAVNINREIENLKSRGFWIAGAEGDKGENIYLHDFTKENVALVLGSEGKGLRKLVKKNCDYLLSVPMRGEVGSYNASVAGALMMGEVARQRSISAHANSVPK